LSAFIGGIVDHLVRSPLALPPAPHMYRRARHTQPSAFASVHDQWLHALRSSEAGMEGGTVELTDPAAPVPEWQRPIAISTATPFRLCFRLEEPEGDRNGSGNGPDGNGTWYVRYLLQAADDPSLLIQAQDAWNPRGSKATLLARGGFSVRAYLL